MSTSHILIALVPGWIEWRLSGSGPSEFLLSGYHDWSLVTPFGLLRMRMDIPMGSLIVKMRLPDGTLLVSTNFIALRPPPHTNDTGFEMVNKVLGRLRYLSCQASLASTADCVTHLPAEPYSDSNATTDIVPLAVEGWGRAYTLTTAITDAILAKLESSPIDAVTPVHVGVMLDAIAAKIRGDHLKALLYAAIAVEVAAAERLEQQYRDVVAANSTLHRVVRIPVRADEVVPKDPVYELLSAGGSFARMLHERPLYLANRSLLIDDARAYGRALCLYRTRNKIAHEGTSPGEEQYLAITADGAQDGLETALLVLRWLGDDHSYEVSDKTVALSEPAL